MLKGPAKASNKPHGIPHLQALKLVLLSPIRKASDSSSAGQRLWDHHPWMGHRSVMRETAARRTKKGSYGTWYKSMCVPMGISILRFKTVSYWHVPKLEHPINGGYWLSQRNLKILVSVLPTFSAHDLHVKSQEQPHWKPPGPSCAETLKPCASFNTLPNRVWLG